MVARGEVRWLELEDEGRRGIDTEVEIGPGDGMPIECAVSLDNLRTVPSALLTEPITKLDAPKLDAVCRALVRSAGC